MAYLSTYKSFLKGPSIKVHFEVVRGLIHRIDLFNSRSKGMECEIKSDIDSKKIIDQVYAWLESYIDQEVWQPELPLHINLKSHFKINVYKALTNLKFGEYTTYKGLAETISSPKAYRAVGQACGSNPLPLIIPCHRVLASTMKPHGFSCGLEVKVKLLEFEGITL